jgi:hypothetical protein
VDAPVAKLDDGVDHLLLLGLEDPLLAAALDDQLQLLRADLRLLRHVDTQRVGDGAGDRGEDGDEGAEQAPQEIDRARQREGEALRVGERKRLRDQLSEDDHEERQDDRDEDERDDGSSVAEHLDPAQHVGQAAREADRGECRGEEADECDADLDDGQEPTRVRDQAADPPRPTAAVIDQLVYPASADGHKRDLCRHEDRVQKTGPR